MPPDLLAVWLLGPAVVELPGVGLEVEVKEGSLKEVERVEVVEEEVEVVGGMCGFFMDHLSLCPLLKVMGRAAISMQRLAFFASLLIFSFLASLWREVSMITLSNSLLAEDEVNVEGGSAGTLSLPSLSWVPSLSLSSSLAVQATPGPSPGVTLWGRRVAPGGATHLIADSSALEQPSLP